MNLQINGAIFDADGTLLNSMHIWNELGSRYLNSLNIKPAENLSRVLYFMSIEQGIEYIKREYKLKLSSKEIHDGIIGIIENFYVNEVELKPGVKNFLKHLNVPKVIATSGDKNLLKAALKRNEIEKYFSEVFTCSELNTTKHESKIFNICAEFLNLKPKNIAVFEDALFAIKTAKEAGFLTVGVEDSSNIFQREEIINTADYYIKEGDFNIENSFNYCRK